MAGSAANKEILAGGALVVAAVLALIVSNSGLAPYYTGILSTLFILGPQGATLEKPILLWINDGLMAVFFFLVGLELKREALVGRLASRSQLMLPLLAAVGGMAVPAGIFAAINAGDAEALRGWAIPAATDIAFAMGVLAVLGSRVPPGVRIFLLALAIIDDLGAIIIIALFYTAELSGLALALAGAALIGLAVLNRRGVRRFTPYLLLGAFLWVCVLKSGVHATLAGVAVAMAIPLRSRAGEVEHGPLLRAEHGLHPWVNFLILPLFAFANAGVSFAGMGLDILGQGITLGIIAGLVIGKPVGVFLGAFLAVKLGIGRLPPGTGWGLIGATGFVAGIGFTMSLFIGSLAYSTPEAAAQVRLGVLSASVIAAGLGITAVLLAGRRADQLTAATAPSGPAGPGPAA